MSSTRVLSGPMQAHATRFRPGEDLVASLLQAAADAMKTSRARSAALVTAVGSLSYLKLRLANASPDHPNEMREWTEKLEIVSLVGTFSHDGGKHVHISVSTADGTTYGGHLVAGTVHTTVELVLSTIGGLEFAREYDDATGYAELTIRKMDSVE